ncbi:MAG: VWA domain-containing protein [Lentisphaerae bacterium]|nr:VWA domain-containing protein [Lentisphaerota bacterium]
MTAIGIDLGTTYSAMATVMENSTPQIIKNCDGDSITPSVVYIPADGEPIVGSEAKEFQAVGESEVASFFKREMGNPDFFLTFHDRKYTPVELSAQVLKKLKRDAEAQLKQPVDAAVITVPAYFNNSQRNDTITAAEMAGLKVLRIINEPTAAAIAYGLSGRSKGTEQTTMVYDLGGGTFDVSIVRTSGNEITVLASDGDHKLGGKDWDDRVAVYLACEFKKEFGDDPFEDMESFNDLLVSCENAKRELSERESTKVKIAYNGQVGRYTLTREKFEELTQDLLERTKNISQLVLNSVPGLTWEKLDGILLVGGSTRMPMVAGFVEKMTGKPPVRGVNVDEAVALGAALQAASDLREKGEFSIEGTQAKEAFTLPAIRDVTCHSLGMVAENQDRSKYLNSIIIPKNSQIPAENACDYVIRISARRPEVNKLEVYMLQGESVDSPLECLLLGKYVFTGFVPVPQGKAQVRVHYAYNKNGTVDVRAEQTNAPGGSINLQLQIEPVPEDMSWLTRSPKENTMNQQSIPSALVIAVDASGSMEGRRMKEARNAANALVEKLDLQQIHVGIMVFSDQMEALAPCSDDRRIVCDAIAKLRIGWGYGNDASPFTHAMEMMQYEEGEKFIVVLTDGYWQCTDLAIRQAAQAKAEGAEIIAIGIGDADHRFLKKVATCDENALMTDLSKLVESFSTIAQVLSAGNASGADLVVPDTGTPKRKGFFSKLFG